MISTDKCISVLVKDANVSGPLGVCVDAKLQPFQHSAEKYDVVIVQGGHGDSTKNYSPFVGTCILISE